MIRESCDGCGLIRTVEWYGQKDVPDEVDPGGYCPECAIAKGLIEP